MRDATGRHAPELITRALVDRSAFGSEADFRRSRAAAWAALITGGLTLTEIAEAVGLSRERVRQILRVEGYSVRLGARGGSSSAEPLKVVAALRDPRCWSLGMMRYLAGCNPPKARFLLQELGLWDAAERLWRARAQRGQHRFTDGRKQRIVDALREFAERTGNTPRIQDTMDGRLPFAHTTAVRYFGSWSAAVAAAGLTPRRRGTPGHAT